MSYQPQPMAPSPAVTSDSPKAPGRGLKRAGVVVAIVAIAAGGALLVMSGSAEQKTVEKFARAPAGCTTTLEFERSDTFEVYLETSGALDTVNGDCAASGARYNHADDDPPRLALSLVDADNVEITFLPGTGETYDVGGYSGQAVQQIRIGKPGSYRLTVTSDVNDFVIAIGGPADADSSTLAVAAVAIVAGGLLLGLLLLLMGKRGQGSAVATTVTTTWPPQSPSLPPQSPSGQAPYAPPTPPDWRPPQI